MEIIKERTIAILGTDSEIRGSKLRSRIVEQLSYLFEREIVKNGIDTFISPLMADLDWLAGNAFSQLRERYPMIRFISVNVVINNECRVNSPNYKSVSRGSNHSIIARDIPEDATEESEQSDFYLDNTMRIYAFYRGDIRGDAANTIVNAMNRGVEVVNINDL